MSVPTNVGCVEPWRIGVQSPARLDGLPVADHVSQHLADGIGGLTGLGRNRNRSHRRWARLQDSANAVPFGMPDDRTRLGQAPNAREGIEYDIARDFLDITSLGEKPRAATALVQDNVRVWHTQKAG